MTSSRTRPMAGLVALVAMVALTFAGCGVKSPNGQVSAGATTTTSSGGQGSSGTVTTDGQTTEAPTTSSTEPDTSTTTEPRTTTTDSGSGGPGVSIPPSARAQALKIYKQLGMTDTQANCVLDAILKQYGSSGASSGDYSKFLSLFNKCGVDITKLHPGGAGA